MLFEGGQPGRVREWRQYPAGDAESLAATDLVGGERPRLDRETPRLARRGASGSWRAPPLHACRYRPYRRLWNAVGRISAAALARVLPGGLERPGDRGCRSRAGRWSLPGRLRPGSTG